jgi:hypothetical protein
MVRALLAGTKTQTRRYLDADSDEPVAVVMNGVVTAFDERERPYRWQRTHAVGDRLYVREHWRTVLGCDDLAPRDLIPHLMPIHYEADGGAMPWPTGIPGRFRQSMHMPRWASRITLTVTDVRVQRLQEISEEDARAEGVDFNVNGGPNNRAAYCRLWNTLHGPGSWDANPFVTAYTFTVAMHNIDQETRHVEA